MQPSSLASSGYRPLARKARTERSTAWYIFDKANTYIYEINRTNFIAANKMFDVPVVTTGRAGDEDRIANEMISTSGTIIQMVDHFIDGARISITQESVAGEIYKRILDHFDHHFKMMKTDKMYEAPDPEDFTHMAEFATAIRPWALRDNPDVEKQEKQQSIMRGMPVRTSFSYVPSIEKVPSHDNVPKITKKLDNIQRWLETQNGG